jgi:hypothetical protein
MTERIRQVFVVVLCDVRSARGVLPDRAERLAHAVGAFRLLVDACESLGHAPPDRFGHRDPEPLGPPLELDVLFLRQLNLCSYHDVMIVTACIHANGLDGRALARDLIGP